MLLTIRIRLALALFTGRVGLTLHGLTIRARRAFALFTGRVGLTPRLADHVG
ncbi:MAG TPA: hypothetical protein VLF19_06980 [Methylomirabilota bacterium]|nr:hypothetical protein [Methylomirabilota bacterium]